MSATAPSTLEGTWALDKLHSTASFAVKHMVVSTFRTSFKDIDATFVANGDEIALTGTVPAESIDIDQPDKLTRRIDDRKRQEPVHHEELASL